MRGFELGKSFKSVVKSSKINDLRVSERDIKNIQHESPNGAEMAMIRHQNAIQIEVGNLFCKIEENNSHWIDISAKIEPKGDPKNSYKTLKMRSGKVPK